MMAQALQCEPFQISEARSFWTTQDDACGVTPSCEINTECGRPGLSLVSSDAGVSYATNDWVRSLALNMLLTDARRRDARCGWAPGTLNGHWSESFIARAAGAQSPAIGTHVRYVEAQASVRDSMLLIKAEIKATLQKLIDYGIAVEVNTNAAYRGNGMIAIDIEILGTAVDPVRIGVTAKRNANAWVWGV